MWLFPIGCSGNSPTEANCSWNTDVARATLVADRAKNWLQTVFVSLQVENRSSASLRVWHADTSSGSATGRSQSLPPEPGIGCHQNWRQGRAGSKLSRDALKLFYLILLLLLIHRDNVMRHRSVCRGRTTSPCCNCNCNWKPTAIGRTNVALIVSDEHRTNALTQTDDD